VPRRVRCPEVVDDFVGDLVKRWLR